MRIFFMPWHKKKEQSVLCSGLEAPPGIEPGVKVLQTSALPLGYGAKEMERETRFELATPALARQCSTTELLPQKDACIYYAK